MRPETYARFDLQCVFNKLDYLTLKRVGELHTNKCLALINAQGHAIECEQSVVEHVQREGYSERFGARPMQNAAMRILGDVVSQEMLRNNGGLVSGVIRHDPKSNRCSLVSA
jgi:ATP-dependent Clp protease ATP-binding subunit ClpC